MNRDKRKAIKIIDERILMWTSRTTATESHLAQPYLTLVSELELIKERIEKDL